jgi:uncharacterized protein YjiK
MRTPAGVMLLAALVAAPGCRGTRGQGANQVDAAALAEREARLAQSLAQPDSTADRDAPLARWVLPAQLAEISGIALTSDGRLLAHNDETGRVFEIDYRRGVVVKQFLLGKKIVHDDFEGIAVAGDRIFMLASGGRLYEFKEGKESQAVPFTIHDTKLGRECEFEGVAFDPAINSLVMACKHVGIKSLKDFLVIYRWNLSGTGESRLTQLKVPMAQAVGTNEWKHITPSDISIDPATGNYVVIAAQERALVVLTPAGEVVVSRSLPNGHDMAEGLAITRDSILVVSDESVRRPATLTLYRWP